MRLMDRHITLDPRLSALAALVGHCESYADIGCDHGRLGAYLLQTGRVRRAQLTDISADSLQKARRLIALLGLSGRVDLRVGDGANALAEEPEVTVIAGMGGALIAIDLFISALTESQVIAAVISIGVGLFIYMIDSLTNMLNVEWLSTFLHNISFDAHFTNFINGIINLTSVVFFLSVIAIFLFLCVRVFEKRRWS